MKPLTASTILTLMLWSIALSAMCVSTEVFSYEAAQVAASERSNEGNDADTVVIATALATDELGNYQMSVLSRVLEVTAEYGDLSISRHPQPMSQSRQVRSLLEGSADVMWSVTSKSRERKLIPIRLPLLRGYSGHRVIVVNAAKKSEFKQITSLEDLKVKQFVQGSDWPDLEILQSNGFRVLSEDWSTWFRSMYLLVERNVVDGFPRNIIEIHNDIRHFDNNALSVEENHLLSYPNYEYFFVRPDKPQLANRIRLGLIRLIQSGELEEIFFSIDSHKLANKLLHDPKRQVHKLKNPLLRAPLDYADWVENPELAIKAVEKELGYPSLAIDIND